MPAPVLDWGLYADDTKIWREIKCWNDHEILQNDIKSLFQWATRNKMKFHPQKCKVLRVVRNSPSLDDPIFPFHTFFYMLGDTIYDIQASFLFINIFNFYVRTTIIVDCGIITL